MNKLNLQNLIKNVNSHNKIHEKKKIIGKINSHIKKEYLENEIKEKDYENYKKYDKDKNKDYYKKDKDNIHIKRENSNKYKLHKYKRRKNSKTSIGNFLAF